ncbi:hypothetical protein [Bosea caraganae]|uniref:hypothetical protein n=1 Tax=Bosea caraganae TaxID=2763117 RepID=UPI0015F09557|nr:hypothetical protein [Bosea caraganae]
MVLDSEDHRRLLLSMINQATVPGSAVEIVADLKLAITNATITEQPVRHDTSKSLAAE